MSHISTVIPSTARFSSLLSPVAGTDDKLFIGSDKTIGFMFECYPLPYSDAQVLKRLDSGFKLPEQTVVQFILVSSDDIERELLEFSAMRRKQSDKLLARMIEERANFLKNGLHEPIEQHARTCIRNFKLFVTIKRPLRNTIPEFDEIEECKRHLSVVQKALESTGMGPKVCSRADWRRVTSSLVNLGKGASWRGLDMDVDDELPLREQILDYDNMVSAKHNCVETSHGVITTLSPMKYPSRAYNGMAQNFIGDLFKSEIPTNAKFFICATIFYPKVTKAKDDIKQRFGWVTQQCRGIISKIVPGLARQQQDLGMLVDDFEDGELPIEFSLTVNVFSKNEKEASNDVTALKTRYNGFGFTMAENNNFHLPFFVNSLPLNSDVEARSILKRDRRLTMKRALPLLPVYGEWRGNFSPAMVFNGRLGQIILADLFQSDTNFNAIIAATSGSGKSFATNYIISMYRSVDAQVWVIDVGRSYKKLCQTLKGNFKAFDTENKICLNPFSIVEQWDGPDGDSEVVKSVIGAMAVRNQELDDVQLNSLGMIINECWKEKHRAATVDDVIAKCLASDDNRITDLAIRLYEFGSKGSYGEYFVGENNAKFNSDFSVLELEELKSKPHLQKIVLLILIYQIQQEMYLGDRSRKKIVIIDEAWDLLSEKGTAKFMETGYRRFRKYHGAAIVITQSVQDLYNTPAGVAIASNSAHKWMLRQEADVIDAVAKDNHLALSEGGYRLFKTVHTRKGEYSEILMMSGGGMGIARLIVDPFSKLLYSTEASEVANIENRIKIARARGDQDYDTEDAIREILAESGRIITHG
jgi:conjugal transfer ATP-binding protein TraC